MRQRGFLDLGIMGYAAIAVAVVVSLLMLALKIQTSRLEAAQETITQIKAVGELAEANRKKEKERADEDYKRAKSQLDRANKRLRDSASSSVLPASAIAPGACISGADVDRALQRFTAGAAELIIEGGGAIEALDNAKRDAQGK